MEGKRELAKEREGEKEIDRERGREREREGERERERERGRWQKERESPSSEHLGHCTEASPREWPSCCLLSAESDCCCHL